MGVKLKDIIEPEKIDNYLITDTIKNNICVYSAHTNLDCVSTGVMTSATAGTTVDAIALPKKNGSATATNCSYVNGETTIEGATKVDAATAAAAIAAIEAQMNLPTFENVAPETGDNTLAALFVVVAVAAVACTTVVLRKREQN